MSGKGERWIVEGLRAGDVDAWNAVYRAHARQVWGDVARRLGPNSNDTADVVQEVFLAAARSAHGYRDDVGNLSQWLSGIVKRKVAMYWRGQVRNERIKAEEVRALFRWMDGEENAPPAILESSELVEAVRATLGDLPHESADLLRQKYQTGKTAVQIAAALDSSVSAIQSKIKRARRRFKETFARRYGVPLQNTTEQKQVATDE